MLAMKYIIFRLRNFVEIKNPLPRAMWKGIGCVL
jgi:hypothetical protein